MKARVIVIDPPWASFDKLTMISTKRSGHSNYAGVLTTDKLKEMNIKDITEDDSILCLWVLGSMLQDGMDVMKALGYRQTQTFVWIKTIKDVPDLFKNSLKSVKDNITYKNAVEAIKDFVSKLHLKNLTKFGMGRLFRQSHEICLIGVKNPKSKLYKLIKNKSQRSVIFGTNDKHSAKPEEFQESLELMFPNENYIELFARRQRPNWVCVGNEAPMTFGEDIFDSIEKIKQIDETKIKAVLQDESKLKALWSSIKI